MSDAPQISTFDKSRRSGDLESRGSAINAASAPNGCISTVATFVIAE